MGTGATLTSAPALTPDSFRASVGHTTAVIAIPLNCSDLFDRRIHRRMQRFSRLPPSGQVQRSCAVEAGR